MYYYIVPAAAAAAVVLFLNGSVLIAMNKLQATSNHQLSPGMSAI